MRGFVRWWETLGRADRIVALSIGLSAPILIIDSAVWAAAVAYIVHEKSRVELARLRLQASPRGGDAAADGVATSSANRVAVGNDRVEWPVPTA